MSWLTLSLVMVALPVVALVCQRVADSGMAERFGDCPFLIDHALEANREVGLDPKVVAVRGGTDGAELSFRGLPCPNIATGGYSCHSVREFVPVRSLELTVDLLERLVAKFAVPQA